MHKIFEKVAKFAELSGHNTKWKIARMESAMIKWTKGPSTQLQMTYQSEIGCDGEHAFEICVSNRIKNNILLVECFQMPIYFT